VDVSNKISYVFSDSLTFSVIVLAAWIVGLIALTAFLFRRQDITS
jgi:ABC-type transport system involved in multi-copper enzyme maturation permease subunit